MSTDCAFLAVDMDAVHPTAVDTAYYTRWGMEHLLGDATPRHLELLRRSAESLSELYETLELPPAKNPFDFAEFALCVEGNPALRSPVIYSMAYWQPSWRVLSRRFCDFLEEESPVAHALWQKLLGGIGDSEWVPFVVGGTEYRLGHGGFLQGDELSEMSGALEPVLPKLPTFYETLDKREQGRNAVVGHAVETIYNLCRQLAGPGAGSPILLYYTY
ncbi:hypothetical protein [Haloprofundus salinisoli]|uniref:hypothetical protein n=1 Tax=Haloprofundus salinisoli TaxID=2876193 RepID=UPI001CCE354E|nr:hypothetical protein [Haloprofundus salinisoli]